MKTPFQAITQIAPASSPFLKALAAVACVLAIAGFTADAAEITWANTSNATWGNSTNWVNGIAPANSLTQDTVLFSNASFTNPTPGTTSIAGITVGSGTGPTGNLTFTSGGLTVGASGITVNKYVVGQVQMNSISIGANQTWTNNSSVSTNGTAGLKTNTVTATGGGNVTLTLAGNGSSGTTPGTADNNSYSIDLLGTISEASGTTLSLVINTTGSGLVSLNAGNTFSGGVTIISGFVQLSNATSTGTGMITLGGSSGSANATLMRGSNTGTSAITVASGNTGTLTMGNVLGTNGAAVYSGNVTMNNNLTVMGSGLTSGGTTLNGAFSGTGNLTLSSVGVGNMTFNSGATINMTGWVANTGSGSGNATIGSAIGTNVTGVIQNSSTSKLVLSGNNTSYAGAYTVNAGTLQLNGATGSLSSSSNLTMGGGTFIFDNVGASGVTNQTLNVLKFVAGDSAVRLSRTVGSNQTLTFNTLAARTAGTTGLFWNSTSAGGVNGPGDGFIISTGMTANLTIDKGIFFESGSTSSAISYAVYDITGYVRAIDYAKDTNAGTSGAVTTIASPKDYQQITGAISGQNTVTFKTLNISGTNNFTLNATQTVTVDGILKSGTAGNAVISGGSGSGIQASSNAEMVIYTASSTDNVTISIPVLANGSNALTKSGVGKLTLNAANAYTGLTTVNAGILNIQNATALGTTAAGTSVTTGAALEIQGGITVGAEALTLNNGNGTGSATGALRNISGDNTCGGQITLGSAARINSDSGNLTLNSGSSLTGNFALTVGGTGNTTISSAIATGTGSLTKDGAGNLTLSGTNTYSGGTTMSGGTLSISNNSSLGTGTITFTAGTIQAVNNAVTLQNNSTLTALTVSGSQNLTINGTMSGALGTSRVLTNNIATGNTLTLGNVDINVETANSRSLTIAGTGNTTVSGIITNSGNSANSLIITNTGTTLFTGANTYAVQTTIGASGTANAGTLMLTGSGKLGNATINVFGGTLDITNTSQNIIALNLGGGAAGSTSNVLLGSGGNLTLGGTVLYSATNNPNGSTISGAGNLNLGGNRTFNVGDSTAATYDLTVSATIANGDGNAYSLTKTGTGTLLLTGNSTYTGGTVVNAGTLQLNGATGSLSSSSNFTLGSNSTGGGTFVIDNIGATRNLAPIFGGITFYAGDNLVTTARTASYDQLLSFSTVNRTSGATGTFTANGTLSVTNGFALTGQSAGFIDRGVFSGAGSTINYAWNDSGYVRAIAYGSDSGAVTSGSTGSLGNATYQQITGAITGQGNATFTTLNINGNYDVTLTSGTTVNSDGILKNGGPGTSTISGGTGAGLKTATSNTDMVINTASAGDNLIINIPILTNAGTSLTKSGVGTLTLGGVSTYQQTTAINAGTLLINGSGSLGSGSYSGSIVNNGVLNYTSSANQTFSGVITGTGSLIKSGTSTLTMSSSNAFTGDTIMNGGIIRLTGNGTSLGSSTAGNLYLNTGELQMAGGGAFTVGRNTIVGGNFTITSDRSSGGSGVNYQFGTLTIGANTLTINAGSNVTSGNGDVKFTTGNITGNTTFAVGTSGNGTAARLIFTGAVAGGSNSITKTGSGELNLTNASTFTGTGGFIVSEGTLSGIAGSFGTQSIILGGGNGNVTLLYNGNNVAQSVPITVQAQTGGVVSIVKSSANSGSITSSFTGNLSLGGNSLTISDQDGNATFSMGMNGVISGSGTLTINSTASTGEVVFGAANTFTGDINLIGGNLTSGNVSAFSTSNKLSVGSGTTFNLNGNNVSLAGLNNVSGSGGSIANTGAVKTLTLGGSGNYTFSGAIAPATTGNISLTKSGTGTQTLGGTNTYTGATTVTGGLLRITGSTASGSAVGVSGGALGGTGTVNGAVSLTGTGGIDLRDGAVGTLTLGSTLSITGASGANNLYFDLGTGGNGTDKIAVTGAVTANNGSGVISLNQIGGSASPINAGTYTLISGSTVPYGNFTLATTSAFGLTFSLTGTATSLQLTTASSATGPSAAYWAGNSDSNWSGANWKTDATSNIAASGAPGYQTNVNFYTTTPAAGNLTTTLDKDYDINSLTFSANATSAVTIGGTKMLTIEAAAVNGNTLGNGITVNTPNSGAPAQTISASVGLASSQTWTVNSGAALTVSGNITDLGGGYSLTKAGTGNLTLSGTNLYTGATTISAGTLQLGSGGTTGSLPTMSAITNNATLVINRSNTVTQGTDFSDSAIAGTGALVQAGSGTTVFTSANTYTGTTTINAGTLQLGNGGTTGSLSTSSAITNNGTFTVNRTDTVTQGTDFSGAAITGTGALVQAGSGTTVLTAANTYTGATTVTAGTLAIAGTGSLGAGTYAGNITDNGTLLYSSSANQTLSGIISGNGSLTKDTSASSTLTLTGTNTYTGATTIGAGPLVIGGAGSLGAGAYTGNITDNSALFYSSSAAQTLSGFISGNGSLTKDTSASSALTLSSTNTYSGGTTLSAGTLNINNAAAIGNGTLTIAAGTIDNTSAAAITLSTNNAQNWNGDFVFTGTKDLNLGTGAVTMNANRTLTVNGGNLTVGGAISGSGLGITKAGTGILTLSGSSANTYTGNTTITAGTLVLNKTAGVNAIAGNITLGDGSGSDQLRLDASNQIADTSVITLVGTVALQRGDFRLNGNNETIGGLSGDGVVQNFSNTANSTLTINAASGTMSSNATIRNSDGSTTGTLSIIKTGSSTQILTNANTYTGGTTLSDGTLGINNASAIGAGAFTIGGGTLDNTSGGAITLSSNNAQTWNGDFSFAGTNSLNLGTGAVTMTGNRTITTSNGTLTVGGVITGSGSLTKNGAGTLALADTTSNTIGGGVVLNAGTLSIWEGNSLGVAGSPAVCLTFAGNSTLTFGHQPASQILSSRTFQIASGITGAIDTSGYSVTMSGNITGAGGALTKTGAGTLTLNGTNNTYTGLTTVSAGALNIGSGGGLASGNALTLGASGTADFANAGQTLGAVSNANTATNALNFSASTGTVTLASLSGAGNTRFGSNGTVTGGISTGTVTAVGLLTADISGGTVGAGSLAAGTVSGGTNTVTGAAGITALNGGTTTVGGVATIGTMSAGTANLNGTTSAITSLNGGSIILGNSTVLTVSNGTTAGAISGGGSLTKATSGTLVLTGSNTYSGPTMVTGGTLLANNMSGSATGSGNVTVASGATLGGNGTIGGATTIAGILSPGDGGIGTLNITGNVTWQGASSNGTATDWIFQLGASNTADLLSITGNFTKDATTYGSNFRFNFEGATNTGTFKVVDWTGATSFSPSDFSYTNLGSGLTGSFSMNGTQLDFSVLPAVPEPSTWVAMAALAFTGGTMAMRRRSRRATGIL